MRKLAVLGGPRRFPDGLAFVRPSLPPLAEVTRRLGPSYAEGQITDGRLVRQLEEASAARLGVDHVVAVASCTIGLMLVWRALEPVGPVVLPGFTFAASAHTADWSGAALSFAECDETTFQLDVQDARRRLTAAGALLATHIFGAPCDVASLEVVAAEAGVPLVFDAAHAFGAVCQGRPIGGFGTAEVFSLTPTKPLVAGEGGLVATMDADLAQQVRVGRNYGNPGDYDSRLVGLNGRMSELHAAVALASLDHFDDALADRRQRAGWYCDGLSSVDGLMAQKVRSGDISTWKDFTLRIDEAMFGLSVAELRQALSAEGVDTRRYFFPPVHLHRAYRDRYPTGLPRTEAVAEAVVSIPIWPGLTRSMTDGVVELLADLHARADEIRQRVA